MEAKRYSEHAVYIRCLKPLIQVQSDDWNGAWEKDCSESLILPVSLDIKEDLMIF
jgi:hypothetical protein